MKKLVILFVILAFLAGISCSREKAFSKIDLSGSWKFRTGDNLAWSKPDYSDSSWKEIKPGTIWEYQGYKKYDGFAWYRIRVNIPSAIQKNSAEKDSIQFLLGKIDDCDQVFLNGEMIGENGKTMYDNVPVTDEFTKVPDKWNVSRRYVLPVNDPRIKWNGENVIAVRVFDQAGAGGMFAKPFEISMVGLKDHVLFDFTSFAFKYLDDNHLQKDFTIINKSGKGDYNGNLSFTVFSYLNGNKLFEKEFPVTLKNGNKSTFSFSFKIDPQTQAYALVAFKENKSGQSVTEKLEVPYILTPKVSLEPRINSARIFGVRPWSPFQFKVAATGQAPLTYMADNLPDGLKIDGTNGIITGVLKQKGDYEVILKVRNSLGMATQNFKIKVGSTISLTPPMGWNSWNCWGLSVSDAKVRSSADYMKSSGLIDHGWTYINIDDGWEYQHDQDGNILTNSKFPDMKALCDYIHSIGLKIGIYSSPGTKTCGGYEGSYTFEDKDAAAYARWGIDYLKYDWCSYGSIAPNPNTEQMKHPYLVMEKALRAVNRDIHYSLCQYGMGDVWTWGASVDGNSWRTTGDIEDTWESMSTIGFSQGKCSPYSTPGRWNDPDMLVVGWVGWGPSLHNTGLTPNEQYTHITLWSLLSAPLLIGCDLSQLDPFTLNLLTNDEVNAIDQDPLGRQAKQSIANAEYQIWIKDLEDGSKAIGLFNLTENPLNIPVDLKPLNLPGRYSMRDLWRQKNLGQAETHFEMNVMPHGTVLLKLQKIK
ncbi:MAG: beta galactosidase jelly roll domain-containing protein [Bacteroidota bacterium]|nr:beta galactosidase jelly roll domain-containing protein [Bacteroidota bacterium]